MVGAPSVGVGLITGDLINRHTKLRLSDEDLEDYLLNQDTTPPALPPSDAAPEPDAAPDVAAE